MGAPRSGKGYGKGGGGKGGVVHNDWFCTPPCGYFNFGYRDACRVCGKAPRAGARTPKGVGKGTGAGGSEAGVKAAAWGEGGIAARQLREHSDARKKEQSKIDKAMAEQRKTIERLQRQLEASKRGEDVPEEIDIDDDDADEDDDKDADKLQCLAAELRQAEACVKNLDDDTPLKTTAKKRAEEVRAEMEAIKERTSGPGEKVLGLASRHARALRSARSKLVRKRKDKAKAEADVDELAESLEQLQAKLDKRKKELAEIKEEEQKLQQELEQLANAGDASTPGDACKDNAVDVDDGRPLGPGERAKLLANQLAAFLPDAAAKERLATLVREAGEEAERRFMAGWSGKGAGGDRNLGGGGGDDGSADTQPGVTAMDAAPQEQAPQAMQDLEESTIELLDAMFGDEGKEPELEAKDAESGEVTRRNLLSVIRKQGATPAKLRAAAKDLKTRKGLHLKPKGAAGGASSSGGGKPISEPPPAADDAAK